jgi:hypothetical protein
MLKQTILSNIYIGWFCLKIILSMYLYPLIKYFVCILLFRTHLQKLAFENQLALQKIKIKTIAHTDSTNAHPFKKNSGLVCNIVFVLTLLIRFFRYFEN